MGLFDMYMKLSKCEDANDGGSSHTDDSYQEDVVEESNSLADYVKKINAEFGGLSISEIRELFSIATHVSSHVLFWNICSKVIGDASRMRVWGIDVSDGMMDQYQQIIEGNVDDWIECDVLIGLFESSADRFLGCMCLLDNISADSDIDDCFNVSIGDEESFITRSELAKYVRKIIEFHYVHLKNDNPSESAVFQPYENYSEQFGTMSIEGLFFLLLDNDIPSVRTLKNLYPFRNRHDYMAVHHFPLDPKMVRDHGFNGDVLIDHCKDYWTRLMTETEIEKYVSILKVVLDDLREYAPKKNDGSLTEHDLQVVSNHDYECDVCGEMIKKGEEAYFRPYPSRVIRHLKCNSSIRFSHEYAYIDYLLKELEFFENTFVNRENCDYRLDGSLTHTPFKKLGYITDYAKVVTRLPFFSEFVMDYISGESDYDLMKKYRPYHVYLEFLFKMKGLSNDDLEDMGGYKYLMRESIGREKFPELAMKLDNVHQSELFWDEYTYKLVDLEVKKVIYGAIIDRIFSDMGIRLDDNLISVMGDMKSYSIIDDAGSDIYISIDSDGIYCTDASSSLPFLDYFNIESESLIHMVDYLLSFEVKQ